MARNVAIGIQNFEELIRKNYFYIDKTSFIKEWWDSGDSVTLITRPRRFGKTLNMSMLERAIMIGITRVSKESIFSDLNNLKVVTTTSDEYATAFGFTEEEVFTALNECGRSEEQQQVKRWYDGFIFGTHADI